MNFTWEIKKELITRSKGWDAKQRIASLSAFLRTCGTLGISNGVPSFFLVSETEMVAEFFTKQFFEEFHTELTVSHATMDRMSGRDKLVLVCPASVSQAVLQSLGVLKRNGQDFRTGIASALIRTEEQKIAYVRGAFLGGGSCNTPKNGAGYHLEMVFSDKKTALDTCILLDELGIFAKQIVRKESHVVYIKSKEIISDFLAIIGATTSLKKFGEILEERDVANQNNRARNCFSGNADKTAIASVKQVLAIQKIEENQGLSGLGEDLRLLAKARLANPEISLRELSEVLGVSKSCLNHRMRKLMQIAEEIVE